MERVIGAMALISMLTMVFGHVAFRQSETREGLSAQDLIVKSAD